MQCPIIQSVISIGDKDNTRSTEFQLKFSKNRIQFCPKQMYRHYSLINLDEM